MAFHNISPVREQLRAEILAALANAPMPMTTSALYQSCPSATQSEEVARVAYELKRKGLIADGGKVPHPRGSPVNSYVLANPEDPRIEAAKPIKAERKIPRTVKAPKPAISNPFAKFSISKPQEEPARITRDLPIHLQSAAPVAALEAPMSEDPSEYVPDPDAFTLEPPDPEAEEDMDGALVDALIGLSEEMFDCPIDPVGEITESMAKKHCQCSKLKSLPKLPRAYRYNAISVDIVSDDDCESMNLLIADEGAGPFAQIDTTGKMRFDSGELAMIGQAADAMMQWLASVGQDND